MIRGKIDVTQIEKARLFKGEKGTYLDFVLIETPNSQYSDFMIVQDVGKDERERGVKGNFLGNASTIRPQPERKPEPAAAPEQDDSIPF